MNEDTITDLKQFIVATTTQQTSDLRTDIVKLELGQEQLRAELTEKIDGLADFVVEALSNTNDATDERVNDHEQRLTRLEGSLNPR